MSRTWESLQSIIIVAVDVVIGAAAAVVVVVVVTTTTVHIMNSATGGAQGAGQVRCIAAAAAGCAVALRQGAAPVLQLLLLMSSLGCSALSVECQVSNH
jgi:hypothetical protein